MASPILRGLWVLPLLASRGAAQSWDDFHFGRTFGEVVIGAELWDEKRDSASSEFAQRELLAREKLALGTRGYFYHPRLVEFDLRGTLGLQQQRTFVQGPQSDRTSSATFPNWNLRADFFKENAYSAGVYSTRAETWTRQSFFPTTRSTVTETGTDLRANEWRLPSRLHVHRYTFDSHGDSTQDMVRDNVLLKGTKFEDARQIEYGLEYNRTRQDKIGISYDDSDAFFTTTHIFGEDRDVRWINHGRARVQTGDVEVDTLRGSSQLFKRWGKTLSGDVIGRYNRTTSGPQFNETINFAGSLGHQLYESLSSELDLKTSRTRLSGGRIVSQGGGARLNYRKKTPLGRLGLHYEAEYSVQDQDDLQGVVPVFDEVQVFTLGVPILLQNRAVDLATVVITDAAGLFFFTEGSDYTLSLQDGQVRVDILVGGLINPGDTLLIDYVFSPNPRIEFSDLSQTMGASFDFESWADINVSYSTVNQSLISGTDTGLLNDTRRTSAGLNLYPLGATLSALYEDYDSQFAPFERMTVMGSYQNEVGRKSNGRLSVNTFSTHFDGVAESERGSSATATLSTPLGSGAALECWAEWHKIHYRTDNGSGFGLEIAWKRRIRSLGLSLRLRHVQEAFAIASDQRVTSLIFSLSRSF